jgi:predicted outer membrane protein
MHGVPAMRTSLILLAVLASCGGSDDDNEQRAINNGDVRGTDLANRARGEIGGAADPDAMARAAAIVAAINAGGIEQARFILSTSIDGDVRDLASELAADHQTGDDRLNALMQGRGMAPADSTVSLVLRDEAAATLAQLRADVRSVIPIDYADMQVILHEEAYVVVGALRNYVKDIELQQFLLETRDTLQRHRKDAGRVLRRF